MNHQELRQQYDQMTAEGLERVRQLWVNNNGQFIHQLFTALVAIGNPELLSGPGPRRHEIIHHIQDQDLDIRGRQYTGSYVPAQNQFEMMFWMVVNYKGIRVVTIGGQLSPNPRFDYKTNTVFIPGQWMYFADSIIKDYETATANQEAAEEAIIKGKLAALLCLDKDL